MTQDDKNVKNTKQPINKPRYRVDTKTLCVQTVKKITQTLRKKI